MESYEVSLIDPVQPYLLQKTARYYKCPVYRRGIQEFFSFCTYGAEAADEDGWIDVRMVPDVGIQLLLSCQPEGLSILPLRPDQEKERIRLTPRTEYFGIRFIPGITASVEHFLEKKGWQQELFARFQEEAGFLQRCHIFKQVFEEFLMDNRELHVNPQVPSIYAMVSESNGDIRIDELSRNLGYSQRYMSKMIRAGFGVSPKTLCKYMKFQKSLEYLGCRNDMDITEVSNALGYYDQSHFVKYFKEFTGITPKNYVSMVRENRLYQKIEKIEGRKTMHRQHETFTAREWKTLFLTE